MVKMPYYLLHRGKTNESDYDRIMFQIVISKFKDVIISKDIIINDSELDEDLEKITKILNQRKNNKNIEPKKK
jgi:succinate dehydrogenase/fumarate reductase-like Fe-S protein